MTLTDKARAGFSSITIRGGRITKWKGQAASFSPQLGNLSVGVSGVALAAVMALTPGAAEAGECLETAPGSNEFECSGAADPVTDVTQAILPGVPVTVTTVPGFGITTSVNSGIIVQGTGGTTFSDPNASNITGASAGLFVFNLGSGPLSVNANGTITTTTSGRALSVTSYGGGGTSFDVTVNNTSGVSNGIYALNQGTGVLNLTSTGTASASAANSEGIFALSDLLGGGMVLSSNNANGLRSGIYAVNSSDNLTITSTGTATGGTGAGIGARNGNGAGNLSITANNTSGTDGILAQGLTSGTTTVISTGTATGSVNGIRAVNNASSGDMTITSNNATGGTNGILATNNGTGALAITSTGTATGTTVDGIYAVNGVNADGITITAADTVGGRWGIIARNFGSGAMTITSTGSSTGGTLDGIAAVNFGANVTDLTVSANNTSGRWGIYARNNGTGTLNITSSGTATGTSFDGIYAVTSGTVTGVTITANDVTGNRNGIGANNNGTGALSITATGTVTALTNTGIYATNGAASTGDLTIAVNNVDANLTGVRALGIGTGATSITATGRVTSRTGNGVQAVTGFNTSTNLSIDVNSVTAGANGIVALGQGTGALSVTARGTVFASGTYGIIARNTGTSLTIAAVDVEGQGNGIDVIQNGSGALSITSTGLVTGTNSYGILARNNTGTDTTINVAEVDGELDAIRVRHYGSGAVSITATGEVTSQNGRAIDAIGSGSGMTITAVDTTGGIFADHQGTGALSVTSSGLADGGIYALGGVGTSSLASTAADTTGNTGIIVRHYGTGAATITSTGTARGIYGNGIDARVQSSGTGGLTINAADSLGYTRGIIADNRGSGALTITSTGLAEASLATVYANSSIGIDARNSLTATDLTITANNTRGWGYGINARNDGTGALSITSTGTAQSVGLPYAYGSDGRSTGIAARTAASATSLTIVSNIASGGLDGIFAFNRGTGALSITATGATTGEYGIGIDAINNGTSLTIAAAGVNGYYGGIRAQNNGSGALTITATGLVESFYGSGIVARNSAAGTDLAITTAAVDSYGAGIDAVQSGSGRLTITANGAVTSLSGRGITATNIGGTDLTINAGDVSGYYGGIVANNGGSGALSITVTGTASDGVTGYGSGIVATNGITATSLTVNANNASGYYFGINASNFGTGALTITSTGTATGFSGDGISASNYGTDLTINANNASGDVNGIFAYNYGSGAVTISSTGTASGGSGDGIAVINYTGTGTTITAATTEGGANGINALHYGSGALTIASLAARGTAGSGINAYGGITGTALSITSGEATGGTNGIGARSLGSGALTITSATATGTTGNGIAAFLGTAGTDLTITSGNASGGANGIRALSDGSGALTITSTGTASGTGADANGIFAFNSSNGTSLTVNVVNANGTGSGIVTRAYGSGANTINLTGSAQGGTGSAIDTFSGAGRLTTINLVSGARVLAGSSGIAIRNDAGNSVVNLASGVTLAGAVRLGDGSDTFNVNSPAASFAGVILDGGDNVSGADGSFDTLNLNNAWSGSLVGANTLNWELINLNGGSLLFSDAVVTAGAILVNGGGRLNGSNGLVVTGTVGINAGSTLLAGNNAGTNAMRISGDLMNMGTIDLRGPTGTVAPGDRLTVGGNLSGAGAAQIILDVRLGGDQASDLLIVGGNLSGSNLLVLNNVGGAGALTTGDGILLVDVTGSSDPMALTLAGGTFNVGAFRYALENGAASGGAGADWFLRSRARDIVASTMSIAQTTRTLGLAALGTLNERVGEQENMTRVGGESGFMKGAWLRAFGSGYTDTITSDALGDSRSNGQYGGLQLGVDLYRGVAASGSRTSVGLFGGLLWAGSDDRATRPMLMDAGTTRTDGYAIGGYVTHVSASDWYVDLAAQRQSLDHFAAATDGTTANAASDSWYASVELGKAFGTKWQIEPQVQLIYGNTDIDDFVDSTLVANRVAIEDSVTGRAGFRLKRTWDNDLESDAGVFSVYAKANVWRQLTGGETTLAVGGSVPGLLQFRETWGDVGLGSTFSLGQNVSAFVDADVEFGLDQGATALSGRTGIMLRF